MLVKEDEYVFFIKSLVFILVHKIIYAKPSICTFNYFFMIKALKINSKINLQTQKEVIYAIMIVY